MARGARVETMSFTRIIQDTETQHEYSRKKYELIDKGPDFMRCAIKMAQIHKIIYLSLPDNMLALEDARMLAQMLKLNTPLR